MAQGQPPSRDEVFCPEQLIHRCLGKIDLVQRVLDRFLETVDHDLDSLSGAARDQDHVAMAKTAHRVKGSAASIAAHRLERLMAALEGGQGDVEPDQIDKLLEEVRKETESLKEVLEEWRGTESQRKEPREPCSQEQEKPRAPGYSTSW